MGQVSHYLHKSVQDYVERIATLLNTSRSEIIDMMIRHVRDEGLEGDIWEDWDANEYTALVEAESEEEESEEATEEEK